MSACSGKESNEEPMTKTPITAIAIHGGAGNLKKLNLTKDEEKAYKEALSSALSLGDSILLAGGSSEDAVIAVITFLEDSPLFNAGKGAVFSHDKKNELDAAIMLGKNLDCGAVTGLYRVKNPIRAAQMVMHKSEHILISGIGADQFAEEQGLEMVDPSYFFTTHRWEQLQEALKEDSISLDHDGDKQKPTAGLSNSWDDSKYGTVGCVALDQQGNLCAGTSTGGLTNKKHGRIGDTPLIGMGTYANNNSCAVSCTGRGEDFIRATVAYDLSARMMYLKEDLKEATRYVIQDKLKSIKGRGGCIAVDTLGKVSLEFTTTGMFRAYRDGKGDQKVEIYK
jgi:beta-aspartyl-peptidase (threonine type)